MPIRSVLVHRARQSPRVQDGYSLLVCIQVLDCIAPGSDEIVLPKTSSSVFSSTNVDYILRSLEKKYLILAGCVTDQCVESAVREACDKHYYVTLVTGEL